jgi:hypothetical protein
MAINTIKPKPAAPRVNVPRVHPQTEVPKGNKPRVEPQEEVPRVKGKSIFHLVDKYAKLDSFFEDGVPVKYLPYVLFVMVITIFYIGNTHYAEKTIRKIDKIKVETEDLRADYTTLKSDYMEASKQSSVARNVAPIGLIESQSPPYQVTVKDEKY